MSDPEPYDLRSAGEGRRADDMPPAPPLPVAPLAYLRRQPDRVGSFDLAEGSPLKNLWLPIILLMVGCAAVLGRMLYFELFGQRADIVVVWRWTGFMLLWNVAVLLLGVLLIAKLTGIGFGPFWTAVLKLAAIAVAPHAVTLLIELAFGGDWLGISLGWLAGIPFAWWLFMHLFDLDPQEALICVGVTTVLRWMSYLIWWFG